MKTIQQTLETFKKAQRNQTVLKGLGKMQYFDEARECEVVVMDLGGIKGVIPKDELDLDMEVKYPKDFVGREMQFIVTEVNDAEVVCSRARAQAIKKDIVLNKLANGEVLQGTIVNILKYGAYVEIDGISGLLKNTDFAEDYTSVGEIHKRYDKINVKFNKFSANGSLVLEAATKYKSPTIIDIQNLSRDQIILGVVRDIKVSGEVFVQIGQNLDALCGIPAEGEVEEDQCVQVRLTKVDQEKRRVRGRIVRVLN